MQKHRVVLCQNCGHLESSEVRSDCSSCHSLQITNYDISNPKTAKMLFGAIQEKLKSRMLLIRFFITISYLSKLISYLIAPFSLLFIWAGKLDMALANLILALIVFLLSKELMRATFSAVIKTSLNNNI